jgi:hypothetical protein
VTLSWTCGQTTPFQFTTTPKSSMSSLAWITGETKTQSWVSDPLLNMRSDHNIPVYNYSKIFNVIIDMDYWRNKDPELPKDALIWFTDGSRTDLRTGSGIYGLKPNKSYSFSLSKFASVFRLKFMPYYYVHMKI